MKQLIQFSDLKTARFGTNFPHAIMRNLKAAWIFLAVVGRVWE